MSNNSALGKGILPREASKYFYIEETDDGLQLEAKREYGDFFITIDQIKGNRYSVSYSSKTETKKPFISAGPLYLHRYIESFWLEGFSKSERQDRQRMG